MDLYEYQGVDLFEAHGVPVTARRLATTPAEAESAAAELLGGGLERVVVKAQVHVGGRGKAGGVKVVASPAEAREAAEKILGMDIKGHTVKSVLVAAGVHIAHEYYVSILVDRANRSYLSLASYHGGMDIEQIAREHPEALARVEVNPIDGVDEAKAIEIARAGGFPERDAALVAPVLVKLWDTFDAEDATLVEVNPMVLTEEGDVLAIDSKVSLDGNAEFRHPDHAKFADLSAVDPREQEAKEAGIHYVHLTGEVGVLGNGAGLVMSTLDVVAYAGEKYGTKPANFLDIGGGASAEVMTKSLDIVLGDPQVRSVFVNVFGGITACDQVAKGIVAAVTTLGDAASKPIVVRLDGNAVEEGRRILAEFDHPLITLVDTMDGAADTAARLAASAA